MGEAHLFERSRAVAKRNDREYFERRAACAKKMAETAADISVRRIHEVMAQSYEAKATEQPNDPIQTLSPAPRSDAYAAR